MTTDTIHGVIEQHAATRGDLMAIADRDRRCSYRELNYRGNAVARHMIAAGFRRGGHVSVRMPLGIDLAVVLLASLKAGGSYSWTDTDRSESSEPVGVSVSAGCDGAEIRYLHLDLAACLAEPVCCCPNLPILTRGSEIACLLPDGSGTVVMVPHATVTALRARAVTHPTPWTGEPGAFDLWMALMAGTTALVEGQAAGIVAA